MRLWRLFKRDQGDTEPAAPRTAVDDLAEAVPWPRWSWDARWQKWYARAGGEIVMCLERRDGAFEAFTTFLPSGRARFAYAPDPIEAAEILNYRLGLDPVARQSFARHGLVPTEPPKGDRERAAKYLRALIADLDRQTASLRAEVARLEVP